MTAWFETKVFDGLPQDLRYAARALRTNPSFALTAIATLAIGIGINAAVFTVTNAVIFKGFPGTKQNDRLVYITSHPGCCVSYPDFEDWRAQAKSFSGMAIVHGSKRTLSDANGFAESYDATEISADTFKVAGASPILGRDFTAADEAPGAPPTAILSYAFWERRYAKDPSIVGQTVRMNGEPMTILGVMPPGFSFPQKIDLWVPLVPTGRVLQREVSDTWFVFGRLKDGVTFDNARAEMQTIWSRLEAAYPQAEKDSKPILYTFDDFFIGPNATLLYKTMWGAVGFVLLIACANLANLLLARAVGRTRELSVRIALGAGRWRIIRQLLLESVMLSTLGGFFGWWIATASVRVYALYADGAGLSDQINGNWFDNVINYSMDYRVFAYLVAISLITGVLFGLAPARRLSKLDVNAALKDGARGASASGKRSGQGTRLSGVLVTAEMALAVVLLAGAGVMTRSFFHVYNTDLGFKLDNLLGAFVELPQANYPRPEAQASLFETLQARAAAMPGVESVALFSQFNRHPYELAGATPLTAAERPVVSGLIVSAGYFRTLEAPMVSGREFNDADTASQIPVAIVNQQFARAAWPSENPVGKRFRLLNGITSGDWLTIVGVAPNIAGSGGTTIQTPPLVYLPARQNPAGSGRWILARTLVPPATLATAFRREVQALDPSLPIVLGPQPFAERFTALYQYRGISGALFLLFAAIALLLASLGLYAVIAHSVTQRTQEIGIRIAIGASARDILQLILRQGAPPLALGLALGLAASLAVNRLLQSMLVQVSPADPTAFAAATGILILAAALGCLIPARRAMRVDPVVALRSE
ncbi:MAG TPA: ABC transporter permease [Bryobacteraceae bacterium]|jgi:predicted permease